MSFKPLNILLIVLIFINNYKDFFTNTNQCKSLVFNKCLSDTSCHWNTSSKVCQMSPNKPPKTIKIKSK